MNLKQIIDSTPLDTRYLLLEYYKDANLKSAKKVVNTYKDLLEYLKTLTPEPNDMVITIHKVEYEEEDDESYYHVGAIQDGEHYGIEFVEWSKWLGMEISEETLSILTPSEILIHCLWEMTFISFDPEEIRSHLSKLEDRIDEINENSLEDLIASGKLKELKFGEDFEQD